MLALRWCAHSVRAVRRSLSLHSHGDGLYGGLGHGDTETYPSPTEIAALKGESLTSIAAGWAHSAVRAGSH